MQWLDPIFKFIERIFKTNAFKKRYRTKSIKKLLQLLKNKKWQIVDTRNAVAYHEHHLEGTINLPVITFNFKYFRVIDKRHYILIISEDSHSHLSIYRNLKTRGFKVFVLNEGYKQIRNNPDFEHCTKVVVY